MKGEWVQDPVAETWHLIVERDIADGSARTWCDKVFGFDAMTKSGALITFMDIVHDECVRKSEEQ